MLITFKSKEPISMERKYHNSWVTNYLILNKNNLISQRTKPSRIYAYNKYILPMQVYTLHMCGAKTMNQPSTLIFKLTKSNMSAKRFLNTVTGKEFKFFKNYTCFYTIIRHLDQLLLLVLHKHTHTRIHTNK